MIIKPATSIVCLSEKPEISVNTNHSPDSGENNSTIVGKFVLIAGVNEIALAYGSIEDYSYHADLVKRYCDINNIPSGWAKKPDQYEILSDSHRILGGGWLEENVGDKTLRFYGYSTAYGGFEQQDILYLLQTSNLFSDYLVDFKD
jgi:hypothetical protein